MTKGRMEVFSDGVLAILITLMAFGLLTPLEALAPLWPVFLSYLLSFFYLAIYWNNHHHMLHVMERIDGRIFWANTHLLFRLSLFAFQTSWMGANDFANVPTALYGLILLCAASAYWVLQWAIIRGGGIGADWKENLSLGIYAVAIGWAFIHQAIAGTLYALVAMNWIIPDCESKEPSSSTCKIAKW
ncbi:MAG: TMEM175 family protein [Gemmataceae bacterium]